MTNISEKPIEEAIEHRVETVWTVGSAWFDYWAGGDDPVKDCLSALFMSHGRNQVKLTFAEDKSDKIVTLAALRKHADKHPQRMLQVRGDLSDGTTFSSYHAFKDDADREFRSQAADVGKTVSYLRTVRDAEGEAIENRSAPAKITGVEMIVCDTGDSIWTHDGDGEPA